jgi:CheY-like chemotaxis protein
VRAIRSSPPDVVLLDVQMPGLDGFGVLRAVGIERMPAIVFVTAFDDQRRRVARRRLLDPRRRLLRDRPDSTGIAHEVEQLHATVVEQLRNAGVQLPDVADVILAEAVRVSLLWLETGSSLD